MKIFVSGGQFFADGFAVRRAFTLEEGEERLLSFLSDEGCGCALIKVQEGELLLGNASLMAITWAEGVELRPAPRSVHLSERVIKEITSGEDAFKAECRESPCSLITISGAAEAKWQTMVPIASPRLNVIEGQREKILEIRAECAEGEYLAMVALAKGSARLLLEDYGKSVLCRGNEVTVCKKYRDLAGREATVTHLWQGNGFKTSCKVICANAPACIREEMGRLLIESVIAKDEESLKTLLCPEIADANALFDFFKGVYAVEKPLRCVSPTAVAALRREGSKTIATVYDFDFAPDGKIENIRCPQEE